MTEGRPVLLALRALKLGDLLVAVPALKGLRRGYPSHRLVLAAPLWLAPLVRLTGVVDKLLPTPGLDDLLPFRPGEVDIAANLHGNGPQSRSIIDALGARVRIVHATAPGAFGEPWVDGINERVRWARLVSAFGAPADPDDVSIAVPEASPLIDGAAVIHIGAHHGSRHWPLERFAEVVRAMTADGCEVVLTGGEADVPRALRVAELAGLDARRVLAGKADLEEFAALIAHAEVLVSVDTGAAHLASAYGTASAVVFGPAPPEEWGPPPGPHTVLTDASVRRGEAFASDPDPALLAVTSRQVIEAARSLRGTL
ncbi:glycosyltransferase family 9 protein [Leucobacter sp. GX24907]